MHRVWPYLAAVAIVAALAGVVIAGRPGAKDSFVVRADQVSTTALPTTVPPTTTAAAAPPDTTTPARVASTSVPDTTTPVPDTTTPASAAATSTTIRVTSTAPTTLPVRARADVRVVVANAAAADGLAVSTAEQLMGLGYEDVVATNGQRIELESLVYFAPGFEREAQRLAVDLGLPVSATAPLPVTPVSERDDDGDVVAVLGVDAQP